MVGNGEDASHVKLMSVDGEIAIVGSGNMDSQSWSNSREFNVLIDDATAVAMIEDADLTKAAAARRRARLMC